MTTNTLSAVAKRHADRTPTWEMALRYPDQGTWTEDEYLNLPGNQLIEFTGDQISSALFPELVLTVDDVLE